MLSQGNAPSAGDRKETYILFAAVRYLCKLRSDAVLPSPDVTASNVYEETSDVLRKDLPGVKIAKNEQTGTS